MSSEPDPAAQPLRPGELRPLAQAPAPLPPGVEPITLWPLSAPRASVSKRFLAVAVDRAQRGSAEDRFTGLLTEFIWRAGALAWDDQRGLFWVNHPQQGWQVAVWLMPVALLFSPSPGPAAGPRKPPALP